LQREEVFIINLNNYANFMPTLCQLMHDVGFIKKYNSGIYMINELAITRENFFKEIKEKFSSVCDGIPTGIPSIFGKAKGFSRKWKVILSIQSKILKTITSVTNKQIW